MRSCTQKRGSDLLRLLRRRFVPKKTLIAEELRCLELFHHNLVGKDD